MAKTTKEKIEVMQAFEDGEAVEKYDDGGWKDYNERHPSWSLGVSPVWDWGGYDYRIKPKPPKVLWAVYRDGEINSVERTEPKAKEVIDWQVFNTAATRDRFVIIKLVEERKD